MTKNQKTTQKESHSFFEGMPCAEMMQKMMGAKKAGQGFNCAEMMSQVMKMCCQPKDKTGDPSRESKETPTSNP